MQRQQQANYELNKTINKQQMTMSTCIYCKLKIGNEQRAV